MHRVPGEPENPIQRCNCARSRWRTPDCRSIDDPTERTDPPGNAATTTSGYSEPTELLALQKSPADAVHRDEHLFQAVHQTSELWLKFACGEIEAATVRAGDSQPAAAVRLLRRSNDALSYVIDQLHMLEHMSPADYAVVRTALGHGAGVRLARLPRRASCVAPSW